MSKAAKPETFRPSPKIRRWLKIAKDAGFKKSDVINKILEDSIEQHVRSNVQQTIDDLRKQLDPSPMN